MWRITILTWLPRAGTRVIGANSGCAAMMNMVDSSQLQRLGAVHSARKRMPRSFGSGGSAVAAADGPFLGTSALLFLASAAGTIYWCGLMSGGMPMPGGWTMSMAWMRMPGQSWLDAAVSFMGMWVVMML